MREWLKRQGAAVKWSYRSRIQSLLFAATHSERDQNDGENDYMTFAYALNPAEEAVCWPKRPECSA
jgi:hypothetical protein